MEEGFYIITAKGCEGCDELLKEMEKEIKGHNIIVLDVTSDQDAVKLVEKLKIHSVPTLVSIGKIKNKLEACKLSKSTLEPEECVEI